MAAKLSRPKITSAISSQSHNFDPIRFKIWSVLCNSDKVVYNYVSIFINQLISFKNFSS